MARDDNMENSDWQYDTAKDLEQTVVERLRRFPREPDLLVYCCRSLAALLLRAYLKIFHRFAVQGKEQLPQEGSFILVANHASHLDALCLTALVPLKKLHRVFPVAAKDYFYATAPRTFFSAVFINSLPFGRYSDTRQSLRLCQELLANPGNVLILFPEGTRTSTGKIGAFKPGCGMLVAGTTIPVVPCCIEGAFAAYPKGRLLPWPKKIRLIVGAPRSYAQLPPGKEAAAQISNELREAILSLQKEERQ